MVESFQDIHTLGKSRWDQPGLTAPFTNSDWLAFGERVYRNDRVFYHLCSASEGRYGAAISAIRINEPLPLQRYLVRFLISLFLRHRPILSCQAPITGFSGLLLERTGRRPTPILQALTSSLEQTLSQNQGSFLIFPYISSELAHHTAWNDEYFTVSLPPGTQLPIVWQDFEEYLFSLKNSVRKDYRLHANRALRMGLVTEVRDELVNPHRALQLIRKLEKRHRTAPNPSVPAMIAEGNSVGGKWIVSEKESELVGCGLMLRDGDVMVLTFLGLEPDVPQVYFSLMYGAIRYAIENGLKVLYGGGGAYYLKSRLGYKLMKNNFINVYSANKTLRRLGRYLAGSEAQQAASTWPLNERSWARINQV